MHTRAAMSPEWPYLKDRFHSNGFGKLNSMMSWNDGVVFEADYVVTLMEFAWMGLRARFVQSLDEQLEFLF